jgi:regulator of RNase E activity RraB
MVKSRVISEDIAAQHARNAKLVENIISHGASLERERAIDCFFHTASEDVAIALSAVLQSHGICDISIAHSDEAGSHPWTVQGSVTSSVSHFTSEEQVERFVRIAAEHDALFDGWGTSLDECAPTI